MTTAGDLSEQEPGRKAGATRAEHVSSQERAQRTDALATRIAELHDGPQRNRLRDELLVLNLGLARAVAHRYRDRGVDTPKLTEAAYTALVQAVQGWHPSSGRSFSSHTVRMVTRAVEDLIHGSAATAQRARRVQALHAHIFRASSELSHARRRCPTPREVADYLAIDIRDVIEALAADGSFHPPPVYLPTAKADTCYLPRPLDPDGTGPDGRADARVLLAPEVRRLAERDRHILQLRIYHGWSPQQIAERLGIAIVQVHRLLTRIMFGLSPTAPDPSTPRAEV